MGKLHDREIQGDGVRKGRSLPVIKSRFELLRLLEDAGRTDHTVTYEEIYHRLNGAGSSFEHIGVSAWNSHDL